MSRNIGRNDPCFCGSGKKYKKCCIISDKLSKNTIANNNILKIVPKGYSLGHGIKDFSWSKLRQLERSVIDKHPGPYTIKIAQTLSLDIMKLASDAFFPDKIAAFLDTDALSNSLFLQWFLFK